MKVIKRIIKFRFVAPDLNIVKAVIKQAPNAVIGTISNKASNCRLSAVHIPLNFLPIFSTINTTFTTKVAVKNQFYLSDIWFLQRMVLVIQLLHCWQQFLVQLVKQILLRFMRKNEYSFLNKYWYSKLS